MPRDEGSFCIPTDYCSEAAHSFSFLASHVVSIATAQPLLARFGGLRLAIDRARRVPARRLFGPAFSRCHGQTPRRSRGGGAVDGTRATHSKQRERSSRSPHTVISLYSLTPTALSPFLVSRRPSSLPLPPPRAYKGISRRRSQRRSRPRTHCLWTRRRPSRTSSRRLSTIINRRDMYAYLCPMGERDACGGS